MKRKTLYIVAAIGLVLLGSLITAALFLVPRLFNTNSTAVNGTSVHRGPGMMGGGMMGGSSNAPKELTAVNADGKAIPADSTSKLPAGTAAQKVGGMTVTLALSPYPPVGFQQATFDVTLSDESGKPVEDAAVSLDLTMPEMPMPGNQPEAKYTENGLYHATGRFTMRGWWRIEVIIQRGGQKQSAFFDVGL